MSAYELTEASAPTKKRIALKIGLSMLNAQILRRALLILMTDQIAGGSFTRMKLSPEFSWFGALGNLLIEAADSLEIKASS